jgi:hypothetical protein
VAQPPLWATWGWPTTPILAKGVAKMGPATPTIFFFFFFLNIYMVAKLVSANVALTFHLGTGIVLLHRHLFDDMARH